ncbi:MAG: hypothetical protein ACXVIY_07645 [Mucilaginibacter sp.]
MTDHYSQNDAAKKSFFRKGLIVLVVLAGVSTIFMTRYALSGSRKGIGDVPDYDDAYLMAKTFVKPTIKSSKITFPESGYQCAQKPDSVFIVKSYAEAKDRPGSDSVTSFEITLKFVGGKVADKHNWKVLNIIED